MGHSLSPTVAWRPLQGKGKFVLEILLELRPEAAERNARNNGLKLLPPDLGQGNDMHL